VVVTAVAFSGGGIEVGGGLVVVPLAGESVGVRSLAVFVGTPDVGVLLDPGVALGVRDGLHPHPREYRELEGRRRLIGEVAGEADVVVVSHYHHDHFAPFFTNYAFFWSDREWAAGLCRGRRVWCKDIRSRVNVSQQARGYGFVRGARRAGAVEVVYADGRAFRVGETVVRFSPPVPHGERGTRLGWVVMTCIRRGDAAFVHAPDVQGPMVGETAGWILAQRPGLLVVGGPPTYLGEGRVSPRALEAASANLVRLAEAIPTVIVDHHLLRDGGWRAWCAPALEAARRRGHRLLTVAEARGEEEQLLEARRSQLYREEPPSQAFQEWVKGIRRGRSTTPPPL